MVMSLLALFAPASGAFISFDLRGDITLHPLCATDSGAAML